MDRIFSDALKKFLNLQVQLWQGSQAACQLPAEFIELILGKGESRTTGRDHRGNQDFQHNPLFWSGRYLEPVINQWLTERAGPEGKGDRSRPSLWPAGKKFAVCLTHDVECVAQGLSLQHFRQGKKALGSLWKNGFHKRNLAECCFGLTTCSSLFPRQRDNQGIFAAWLAMEASYGFKSTFFFFPDQVSGFHPCDRLLYRYSDRVEFEGTRLTVAELMREIDGRGWEVGLKGTFNSYDNAEELKRQKEQVEKALGKEIASIRQHYLHFDIVKTPRAQYQAGFRYDTSYGSNRIIGFRNGLAAPFYFYDLTADAPLDLLEIPLHLKDRALLRADSLSLSPPLALKRAKEIIDKVEAVNGVVTLLWHPSVELEDNSESYLWVYQELLQYLSQKDAWVTSVKEIGQWWDLRRKKQVGLTEMVNRLTRDCVDSSRPEELVDPGLVINQQNRGFIPGRFDSK